MKTKEEYIQYCLPFLLGEKQHATHATYGDFIHYGNMLIFRKELFSERMVIYVSTNFDLIFRTLFNCDTITDYLIEFLNHQENTVAICSETTLNNFLNGIVPVQSND